MSEREILQRTSETGNSQLVEQFWRDLAVENSAWTKGVEAEMALLKGAARNFVPGIKEAARHAVENPLSTGVKLAGMFALGYGLGCVSRASIWHTAARTAFAYALVADGVRPMVKSTSFVWDNRNDMALQYQQKQLGRGLGHFAFDLGLTLPAIGLGMSTARRVNGLVMEGESARAPGRGNGSRPGHLEEVPGEPPVRTGETRAAESRVVESDATSDTTAEGTSRAGNEASTARSEGRSGEARPPETEGAATDAKAETGGRTSESVSGETRTDAAENTGTGDKRVSAAEESASATAETASAEAEAGSGSDGQAALREALRRLAEVAKNHPRAAGANESVAGDAVRMPETAGESGSGTVESTSSSDGQALNDLMTRMVRGETPSAKAAAEAGESKGPEVGEVKAAETTEAKGPEVGEVKAAETTEAKGPEVGEVKAAETTDGKAPEAVAETPADKAGYPSTSAVIERINGDLTARIEALETAVAGGGGKPTVRGPVEELLPHLDNADLARTHMGSGTQEAGMERLSALYDRIVGRLAELGIKRMNPVGQRFDPTVHEAIERVTTTDVADNVVVAEVRSGYIWDGELLRPARVKVSFNEGKAGPQVSSRVDATVTEPVITKQASGARAQELDVNERMAPERKSTSHRERPPEGQEEDPYEADSERFMREIEQEEMEFRRNKGRKARRERNGRGGRRGGYDDEF